MAAILHPTATRKTGGLVIEQRANRLIRPSAAEYVGPESRPWVPLAGRG